MKTGNKGIELIKRFEHLMLNAYKCPAGVWTIGYGHTSGVEAGMEITEEQAEVLLVNDIKPIEALLNGLMLHLNQNQFDALVSFIFNVGADAFLRSTLLRRIKEGVGAKDIEAQFMRWVYADGKRLSGLIRRRIAEADLYNSI